MCQDAVRDLDGDQDEIQRGRNCKGSPECVGRMSMAMAMRVTMSRAVPVIVWMAMILILIVAVIVMRRHGAVKAFLPLAGNIHT